MLENIKSDLLAIFDKEISEKDEQIKTLYSHLEVEKWNIQKQIADIQKQYKSSGLVNFKKVYNVHDLDDVQTSLRLLSFMNQIKKDNQETIQLAKDLLKQQNLIEISDEDAVEFKSKYQSSIVKQNLGKFDNCDDIINDIMLSITKIYLERKLGKVVKIIQKLKKEMSKESFLKNEIEEILK